MKWLKIVPVILAVSIWAHAVEHSDPNHKNFGSSHSEAPAAKTSGFEAASFGLSYNTPSGYEASNALLPGLGYNLQARAAARTLITGASFILSLNYSPMSIRNVASSRIDNFSGFIGMLFQGEKPGVFKLNPYLGILAGGQYSTLRINTATANTSSSILNSAIYFSAQILPGIDLPLPFHTYASFSFPVTYLANYQNLFTFSQMLSLGYHL